VSKKVARFRPVPICRIRHGRKRDISGGDSFFLTREFLAQMMGASNATAFHWSQASCNARVSSIAGAGVSTCSTSKGLREISFECYATVKATGEGLAWRSPASNISAHFGQTCSAAASECSIIVEAAKGPLREQGAASR